MKTSEKIGELAKALSAAQGEFTNPERNRTVNVTMRTGGSYSFDYATFDAILAGTRPILAKHGLAVVQGVSTKDGGVTVTTRLAHESSEWVEDEISGDAVADDKGVISLQAIGSAITYLKRYSYTAMLNIAAEEDDDGAAGSGHSAEKKEREKLPACPNCGKQDSVIRGKEEYGTGGMLVCWKKKEGCDHKWNPGEKAADPAQEQPKGTRTARADAKKKADEPTLELTEVEKHAVAEIRDLLAELKSIVQYDELILTVKKKSAAVQLAVSPDCLKRKGELLAQGA